jgi:phosphohistidine phosphatase
VKYLFLLRHAKAIPGELNSPDCDRPLSDRGFKDSQQLAAKLVKKNIDFDVFMTSHAIRAITTAQIIANALGRKQKHIAVEKLIYEGNPTEILQMISLTSKKINSILLVGHNPSISEIAFRVTHEPILMTTCSLIELSIDIKRWDSLPSIKSAKARILN